jgi:hypothetical protein
VDRLLPNLEPETLAGLQELNGFVDHAIKRVFAQADHTRLPWWSHFFPGAAQYKVKALMVEFTLMQMELTAFIEQDQADPMFWDVRALAESISELQRELIPLEKKLQQLIMGEQLAQKTYLKLISLPYS